MKFQTSLLASVLVLLGAGLAGCSSETEQSETTSSENPTKTAYASTYKPYLNEPTLLAGATVLLGNGERLDKGDVYFADGKIVSVGPGGSLNVPETVKIVDASEKWITPGIVDNHSHLGVYPSPGLRAVSDGNESVQPNTAYAWAEHAIWTQDAGFSRALAGGITSLQILPGSANLFGGRSATVKNVPGRTVQEMKFPGAPHGVKMACGENPKGSPGYPETRMGVVAGYREAFIRAKAYKEELDEVGGNSSAEGFSKDLTSETLAGVLNGDIKLHIHCYRADDMGWLISLAKEFDFQISSFHHAVEGYKIADYLAKEEICGTVWADWWGFKLEAFDMVPENAALIDAQPGGCAIIHSDSSLGIQRLNQEAAKAMASGRRRGMDITPEHAIRWITQNPAKSMGILESTGTLEAGKMADIVVWNQNPFSVYAKAEQVFIDGAKLYDRFDPELSPRSDVEMGVNKQGFRGGAGQ